MAAARGAACTSHPATVSFAAVGAGWRSADWAAWGRAAWAVAALAAGGRGAGSGGACCAARASTSAATAAPSAVRPSPSGRRGWTVSGTAPNALGISARPVMFPPWKKNIFC